MTHTHGPGSPECRELFACLSEYLDGELDPGLCADVEGHLEDCPPCQAFLESLRRSVALLRETPETGLPADLARDLIEKYRKMRDARDR